MKNQLPNPSKPVLYGGLSLLVLLLVASVVYFMSSLIDIVSDISGMSEAIEFDKGAYYLPGVALGLFVLIYAAVYESVLRREMTKRIAGLCTRVGVGAVLFMFLLPQVAQFTVDAYLLPRQYMVCGEASHQWLHARTIVYTSALSVCEKLVADKKH